MCSVELEPLKSKLLYWRDVSDAICSLDLYNDMCIGDSFDEHWIIENANDRIYTLSCELDALTDVMIGHDDDWACSWPYAGGTDYEIEDDENNEEHIAEVERYRVKLIEDKQFELEDEIEEHIENRDSAKRRLGCVPADAMEAVRFLLCGGKFQRSFN